MYAMNRVNKMGLQYHLQEQPDGSTKIVTGDKSITVNHNIHEISQAWYNWQMRGERIQVAFMFLTDAQREFLITGYTEEEWTAMWARIESEE
jgi:hypothetical protein